MAGKSRACRRQQEAPWRWAPRGWRLRRWSLIVLVLNGLLRGIVTGEELVVFGAGSLREVLTQVATEYQTTHSVPVRTEFGPSGLMRERIEKAKAMLVAGEQSVTEIALSLGFSSQSHFTDTFRKQTGTSPRRFAKQS